MEPYGIFGDPSILSLHGPRRVPWPSAVSWSEYSLRIFGTTWYNWELFFSSQSGPNNVLWSYFASESLVSWRKFWNHLVFFGTTWYEWELICFIPVRSEQCAAIIFCFRKPGFLKTILETPRIFWNDLVFLEPPRTSKTSSACSHLDYTSDLWQLPVEQKPWIKQILRNKGFVRNSSVFKGSVAILVFFTFFDIPNIKFAWKFDKNFWSVLTIFYPFGSLQFVLIKVQCPPFMFNIIREVKAWWTF